MPTGWTPAVASSTLEEWTRTFSRGQQCSCFRTRNTFCRTRSLSNATFSFFFIWRSFAVNGPTVWNGPVFTLIQPLAAIWIKPSCVNSLPPALRSPGLSQNTFKRTLKTHLFSSVQRHWVVLNETLPLLINLLTYLLTYLLWTHNCDYSSSRPPKATSLRKSASSKL